MWEGGRSTEVRSSEPRNKADVWRTGMKSETQGFSWANLPALIPVLSENSYLVSRFVPFRSNTPDLSCVLSSNVAFCPLYSDNLFVNEVCFMTYWQCFCQVFIHFSEKGNFDAQMGFFQTSEDVSSLQFGVCTPLSPFPCYVEEGSQSTMS